MAQMSSYLLQEVSGSARMALLLWSFKTMRYLIPREEVTVKRPVWTVHTFLVKSTVGRYAIWSRTLGSCKGKGRVVITGRSDMGVTGEVVLVDHTFCWSWRR